MKTLTGNAKYANLHETGLLELGIIDYRMRRTPIKSKTYKRIKSQEQAARNWIG